MAVTLKPFSIGPVEIELPATLASMAGYTDLAYRMICRDRGADYCATEMMLDKCLLAGPKLRNRLAAISPEDHPVGGQLIGNDPDLLVEAAQALCEIGFDVIDLNFACPVNKAIKRRRGGYLMSQPDRIIELTRAVVSSVDRPVGLKLRRKYAEADGDDAFYRIAEGAFNAGAAVIAVHGRSVEAKYTGMADWSFITEAKRRFSDQTILGSGDVHTPQAALDMLERTGVDGVLVARGALGNPWFFRQMRDLAAGRKPYLPDLADQRQTLLKHFEGACELYGQRRGPKIMRKFGIRYARLHPCPRDVRMAFVAVKTPRDWHEVVDRLYEG